MDNLQTPQSQETKDFLEKECGLRPYAPTREPNYANPDKMECKFSCESIDITLFLQITCLALESSVCPSRAECTQDRLVFPPFLSLSLSSWCLPSTSWQFTTRKSALTSHRVSVRPSSRTSSSTQSLAAHGTAPLQSTTAQEPETPTDSEHHSCCTLIFKENLLQIALIAVNKIAHALYLSSLLTISLIIYGSTI